LCRIEKKLKINRPDRPHRPGRAGMIANALFSTTYGLPWGIPTGKTPQYQGME
jgi:hypothetical protein